MTNQYPTQKMTIVGAGIIGAMESLMAYRKASEEGKKLRITVYEKNASIKDTTVTNIAPSLSPNAIFSVVPRGQELTEKLALPFSEGGLRIDDVAGINDSQASKNFKNAVEKDNQIDAFKHEERSKMLLTLGKKSMDMWDTLYNTGDDEFKSLMEEANYNPCKETEELNLHNGYRIDLIYNVENAANKAVDMVKSYHDLGYQQCTVLSPQQVSERDPFLANFCESNSENSQWKNNAVALWRPGGCIDAAIFLPKLYAYLENKMGTYINEQGKEKKCFQIHYNREVMGVGYDNDSINSLKFQDCEKKNKYQYDSSGYVFAPGEAVGTLTKLGFIEPAYAGFAGASLKLNIEVPTNLQEKYLNLNQYREIYKQDVAFGWQAKYKNGKILISVAGAKAFYGDQKPEKYHKFCTNRTLLQLNTINEISPEFMSIALRYDTKGKILDTFDLDVLVGIKVARRWAGVRAAAYDGVPTLGALHKADDKTEVSNARVTTGLGSGGVSFAPITVEISRTSMAVVEDNSFTGKVLQATSSVRIPGIA